MSTQKLTDLQLELLNIYSFQPKQEDMLAIKQLLAEYFAKDLQKNIQQAIEKNNISEDDLDKWVNE